MFFCSLSCLSKLTRFVYIYIYLDILSLYSFSLECDSISRQVAE